MATRRAFIAVVGASLVACAAPRIVASPTPRLRRIGWLSGNAKESVENLSRPFVQRLRDLGYVEGRDFAIEWRIADTKLELLPSLAQELVALPVDVIVAEAGQAQTAAQHATKVIPVVFVLASDPLRDGFVASLAHPGGNMTGMTTGSNPASIKRVEMLKETASTISKLAVLWNLSLPQQLTSNLPATIDAARALGIAATAFPVRTVVDLEAAETVIEHERYDALIMLPSLSVVRERLGHVPDFANRIRLPQGYADEDMVRAGGLMSFNANRPIQYRRAADFVDKILRGARPEDLPVEQPPQFDLILNLATAQRIGLTVPPSVLAQAVEVIR